MEYRSSIPVVEYIYIFIYIYCIYNDNIMEDPGPQAPALRPLRRQNSTPDFGGARWWQRHVPAEALWILSQLFYNRYNRY